MRGFLNFLALRRYNLVDGISIGIASVFFCRGDYLAWFLTLIILAPLSVAVELMARKSS